MDESAPVRRTGVLLLAHAPLAGALARVAMDLDFVNPPMAALDMPFDMSREQALAMAKMLVSDLNCGGLLVLVDVGGGASPCVVAQQLQESLGGSRARVVAGLNLPMLITALCHCHLDVDALAVHAAARGRDGVQEIVALPWPGELSTLPPSPA